MTVRACGIAFGAMAILASCTSRHSPALAVALHDQTVTHVPCTTDSLANGDSLRAAIEGARRGATIQLGGCLYRVRDSTRAGSNYVSGILIRGDTGLTIRGQGPEATRVRFGRRVLVGLEIVSNVVDLTIRDLTISGSITGALCESAAIRPPCYTEFDTSATARPPTRGIGSTTTSNPDVSGVVLENLVLTDLAVGIDLDARMNCTIGARFTNVTVAGNLITGIHGTYGGSGYGIWNSCADHVVIRDNVIWRTTRHAIYQGDRKANNGPVIIMRNTIVDHGHSELQPGITREDSAKTNTIDIARSRNVTAIDNRIIHSHTYGLSTEWELDNGNKDCTRCLLIGNKFMNVPGAPADIWVRTLKDTTWLWFNTRADGRPVTTVLQGPSGDASRAGCEWNGTSAVAVGPTADQLLVTRNDSLHVVAFTPGVPPRCDATGAGWLPNTSPTPARGAKARLSSAAGEAYAFEGDAVYRERAQDGSRTLFARLGAPVLALLPTRDSVYVQLTDLSICALSTRDTTATARCVRIN